MISHRPPMGRYGAIDAAKWSSRLQRVGEVIRTGAGRAQDIYQEDPEAWQSLAQTAASGIAARRAAQQDDLDYSPAPTYVQPYTPPSSSSNTLLIALAGGTLLVVGLVIALGRK